MKISYLKFFTFEFLDNTTLLLVLLVDIIVDQDSLVSDPSPNGKDWEEKKGKKGFPWFNNFASVGNNDDVKPDVGEDRPGSSNKEDSQVLDLTDFIIWDNIHANSNDNKQVEGSGTDNGGWSKVTSFETSTECFDNREKNFWRR